MVEHIEIDWDQLRLQPAGTGDCEEIARLYQLSSDGVADYIWSTLAEPDEPLLDVGARRYARENTNFSYQNCILARQDNTTLGMLFAFPMKVDADYHEQDPVLQPYSELEEDNSYYISGVAVYPAYQGQGLGQLLMSRANMDCVREGLERISLLVFEQNLGAKALYDRLGFQVIDRRPVVPHPLIHFEGDVLLMSRGAVES